MSSAATDAYIDDFSAFIADSPSSYHAAAAVATRLDAAGFTRLDETVDWAETRAAGPSYNYVVRDGAVIAWIVPADATPTTPYRILGAHTDSPAFKLKPKPTTGSAGWLQAGVEVYGGPLLNSWLDRELELAGRIVSIDGTETLVRTGPLLRIPQLAIHLDREVNNGLTLDKQRHVQPIWGVGDASRADLLAHIAGIAGVRSKNIAGFDLLTAPTQRAERFGQGRSLLAASRMDNLSSVFAGLTALLHARTTTTSADTHISVLAAFDHEELGSESRSGASGPFLADVLVRLGDALGATEAEQRQAIAGSWCLSADAGHAVHPNYPERHDPVNRPVAGGGPLLKINANQRYATDAHGAALWARTCWQAGVEFQEFVSNNQIPCGSTIGPLTATRIGIRTVDVGVPLLSMHSARELAHVDDLAALARVASAFFTPRS
jgi:aspartyl aminopeptidase